MVTRILQYFKNPDAQQQDNEFYENNKLKFLWTCFWMAIIGVFCASILIAAVEAMGLIDTNDHQMMDLIKNKSLLTVFGVAIIIAPVLEELIFRAPLTIFENTKPSVFKWIFYGVAVLFGLVHITNYDMNTTTLLLIPILTAPQIIAGFFLGMIRMKLGVMYSILFHAFYNAFFMIPTVVYFKYFMQAAI